MNAIITLVLALSLTLAGCGAATKKPDPIPISPTGEYMVYKPVFAEVSLRLPEGQMIEMRGFRLGPGPLIEPEGEISPVQSEDEKKRSSLLKSLGEMFSK